MERKCEHLLSYMADTLKEEDRESFEAHMKKCDACRKEYAELIDSWEALQFDFEEQQVPESLKADVFDFVFNDKEEEKNRNLIDKIRDWGILLRNQFTPLSASLVFTLVIATAILMFINGQSGNVEQMAGNQQAEIMTSLNLKSANDELQGAGGYAYVVQQDNSKKLVVQVDGLPKLAGSHTYQVWLLKDGERLNAGIFNTDDSGAGILTYTLPADEDFDQIGITREPALDNTQPEGQKVMGS
ncbi:hypothetical protein BME96_15520 [Virgibacillus halodenitrificans]|uniref:Regulator of SigK n=1 Tax=Virgibacillus halodenitrificans TaxID=1482 RepID=A0AAC9J174_VIRHA|nr:anti-sigma factor [Virgibacillus halodenitrificans]APC49516.1 hypothetical protein BME96_15520 [Virgibacillus halodenitrificans]